MGVAGVLGHDEVWWGVGRGVAGALAYGGCAG